MAAPWLSVVIPTYNEAANIGPLLTALKATMGTIPVEYVVVDDDSRDGTPAAAAAAAPEARVIVRTDEKGLATAVVRGMREAKGTYVAVMDADFQHPPAAVLSMLEKALDEDADLVIGSRYAAGGSQGNFGPARRAISWGAGLIGRLALPPVRRFGLTDPMSGLFLVRRDKVDADALRPAGYKILLEVLGRSPLERVVEVGYQFQDRRGGESKLGAGVMWQYLTHAVGLGLAHPDNRRMGRFALVGLTGVVVNLAILWLLHGRLGLHDLIAVPIAVEASILSNFLLNDRFTFQDRQRGHMARRLLQFNLVSLTALVVNLVAYTIFNEGMGIHYLAAEALAIVVAFGANYAGNLHWTYGLEGGFTLRRAGRRALPYLPVFLIAGAAAFVYIHDIDRVNEIYFDEHYYVSVARQMDNGIWEDPCWTGDGLNHRPLNYEHPPLAKLLIYWSVKDLDTDHAVFEGCRSPDDSNAADPPCNLVEHGEVVSTHESRKACYDAFTARAKSEGNPVAWRLPSALLGVAAVLFAGLAAQRIFQSHFAGGLAAALVLMDTMVFTSARLAILDIFCAGFTMAAVWAATFPSKKGIFWTATLLGLAFACKYSVLFAGPAILILVLWTHRRAGLLTRRRFDLSFVLFPLMALVVWVASYWPWWIRWVPARGVAWSAQHWFEIQKAAFSWGTGGYQTHPYASPPIEWFAQVRPTWYYHIWGLPDGKEGWVYAVGNPVLWWLGAAVALAALMWVPARLVAGWRPRWLLGAALMALRGLAAATLAAVLLVEGSAVAFIDGSGGDAATAFGLGLGILLWAVCVGALAFLVYRRLEWARVASAILSGVGVALSLLLLFQGRSSAFALGGLAADLLLLVLLMAPDRRSDARRPFLEFRSLSPAQQALAVAALLPAAAYAGFFLVDRVTFLFYMTLIVPLLCLPLAGYLASAWSRGPNERVTVAIAVLAVLAAFVYYHPVAASVPIDPAHFHRIMGTVPWMQE